MKTAIQLLSQSDKWRNSRRVAIIACLAWINDTVTTDRDASRTNSSTTIDACLVLVQDAIGAALWARSTRTAAIDAGLKSVLDAVRATGITCRSRRCYDNLELLPRASIGRRTSTREGKGWIALPVVERVIEGVPIPIHVHA